jgi:hypothetical protein
MKTPLDPAFGLPLHKRMVLRPHPGETGLAILQCFTSKCCDAAGNRLQIAVYISLGLMTNHMQATVGVCLCLAVTGCAEDRYAYNMRRAYVTPWTHLSPADRSEIVRLVTAATEQGIQGISKGRSNSKQISVFTGFSGAEAGVGERFRWHEFVLEKHSNRWHIVSQQSTSPSVGSMLLSYPP